MVPKICGPYVFYRVSGTTGKTGYLINFLILWNIPKNFISFTGNQNVHGVSDFMFFFKYFLHISPVIALNVFSTWIITKIQLSLWYLWKEFQDELNPEVAFTKRALTFWIIPIQGFSHFRQLLLNHGLKEMSEFPSSPISSVKKNLRSTAL